ncbi:MAG: DEAD/DEAH box helicase [Rhodanobacteraceae bacterium]|nr:MAG: DEAD/DEAH box helicase [Rhodanobacteraceae bacterium]
MWRVLLHWLTGAFRPTPRPASRHVTPSNSTLPLRPYQEDAIAAAIKWMRRSVEPACIELPTGAGKSWCIAAIADWVREFSGKRVLVTAPGSELVEQDYEKYLETGREAGIFSASVGRKDAGQLVTYGTPVSIFRANDEFAADFGAVIVDEAHRITPTIRKIIARMQAANPNLRALGLTATPYRLGTGYVYRYTPEGQYVPDDQAVDPYFNSLLYRITTHELIKLKYLTPVVTDVGIDHYITSSLRVNRTGTFDAGDVQAAFEHHDSLTAKIVETVVEKTRDRCGVLLFASTVQHAKEILKHLPRGQAKMIGGKVNMTGKPRKELLKAFKAAEFKYLVNVDVLTTGFDAPHIDAIAVLRATESPGLLEQIIGRGLRLSPETNKHDCLFMDFAENVERHGLGDDLFDPTIKVRKPKAVDADAPPEYVDAVCPQCQHANHFKARENPELLAIDGNGYFLDVDGKRIPTPFGNFPAHFGRHCRGQVAGERPGKLKQCGYRWLEKACPDCKHVNDVSAKQCSACGAELVDPEDKLTEIYSLVVTDPFAERTEEVVGWDAHAYTSRSGRPTLLIRWNTKRGLVPVWYSPERRAMWRALCAAVFGPGHVAPDIKQFLAYLQHRPAPRSITYRRQQGAMWNELIDYNREVAPAAGASIGRGRVRGKRFAPSGTAA